MKERPSGGYRGKRIVDLTLLLIVAVPVLIVGVLCALAVKATSPGPVFFLQQRIGLGGNPFIMWKFRTMMHRADNPIFPSRDRITVAGRWLRRLSLDELPQLMNVARGEMSIVGPRPTMPYQVARYNDRQRRRLSVRPGLTGLAQIRGRNSLAWEARIEHDLEYIERQSVWLDVVIIFRTLAAVASAEGADGHPTDDPLAEP